MWPAVQPESWKSPGIGVGELKEQFGTPLFVVSEDDFRARARAFKQAFDDAFSSLCGGVDVYYAGKAFLSVEIARWVAQEGLRLDTCSGGELAVAARAGSRAKTWACTATTSRTPRSTAPWTWAWAASWWTAWMSWHGSGPSRPPAERWPT